jgi:hypothetical protein
VKYSINSPSIQDFNYAQQCVTNIGTGTKNKNNGGREMNEENYNTPANVTKTKDADRATSALPIPTG